jgi:Synergist-CTERM protein sorting domain-containing protein
VNGWTIYSADSINRGGGSSGGGCDAGFGALALMALAGSAIVLRRKK